MYKHKHKHGVISVTPKYSANMVNRSAKDNKIVPEKSDRIKNITELFREYDGAYVVEEVDWGEPVGREIW